MGANLKAPSMRLDYFSMDILECQEDFITFSCVFYGLLLYWARKWVSFPQEVFFMKTKYWIILLAVLLLLSGAGGIALMNANADAAFAEIISDGELLYTLPLSLDTIVTVTAPNGGQNVITVKDGKIAVTDATCPDHYCMVRGFCSGGTQIVCLPNRLVIAFTGEQEIDGMIG